MPQGGAKTGRSRRKFKGINKRTVISKPSDDDQYSDSDTANHNASESLSQENYSVERVVSHRINDDGDKEYEIKWKGFPSDQNTWEPLSHLSHCKSLVESYELNIHSNDDVWIGLLDDIDQNTMNHQTIHKNTHSRRIKTYGRSNTNRRCALKPIVSMITEDTLKSDENNNENTLESNNKPPTKKRSDTVESLQSVTESPLILTKRQKRKRVLNGNDEDDDDDDVYRPSISLETEDTEERTTRDKKKMNYAEEDDEEDEDNDEDSVEETYEVEIIRKHRKSRKRDGYPQRREDGERCIEYYVKWKDWDESTNTWEHESKLTQCSKIVDQYWDIKKKEKDKKAGIKKKNVRKIRKQQNAKETEKKSKKKQNFKANRTLPFMNDDDNTNGGELKDKEKESNVDKREEEDVINDEEGVINDKEEHINGNDKEEEKKDDINVDNNENEKEKKSRKRALSPLCEGYDDGMENEYEPPRKKRRIDETRELMKKGGLEMFMKILDDDDTKAQDDLMDLVKRINE